MTITREDCIAAAGRALAAGRARRDSLSPRQAAEEAYVPGGPSVEQLEARIRAQRTQTAQAAS